MPKVSPKTEKVTTRVKDSQSELILSIMDLSGKSVGKITLPKEIFSVTAAPSLIAQAVRVFLANQREGNASTKTRGEVRGSTRKIYRQKGTGKARHGGIRAPIFVGGGIVFGPKPRDFSLDLPKKMRAKSLSAVLTEKLKNEKIIVLAVDDTIKKTREISGALKALNLVSKRGEVNKILLVISKGSKSIFKASKNIEGLEVENANDLNTYDVLDASYVIFQKNAIEDLSKRLIRV